MKQIKNLTDAEINYWVAKAQGYEGKFKTGHTLFGKSYYSDNGVWIRRYEPVVNWVQCGALINDFKPYMICDDGVWEVQMYDRYSNKEGNFLDVHENRSTNLKKAICLAVIISVYGEEVGE